MAMCLLFACSCAQAAVRMQAATLNLPGVSLAGVHLEVAVGSDGRPLAKLDVAKMSLPALGWRDVTLALRGEPQRVGGNTWRFVGKVETKHAPGGALASADIDVLYDPDGGTLEVDMVQGKSRLQALLPLDQATHVQMTLAALPLAWLRGVLDAAWPGGRLNGGNVAGTVALDLAPGGTRVSGRVDLAGVDLDSKAGNVAAQKLAASGSFRIENGLASTSFMFDGSLQGGQVLLGPLYAQLPAHAVNLHVAATLGLAGIDIGKLDFNDSDALQLAGSLGFDRKGNLDKLDLTHFAASFPAAYVRYGSTLVQGFTGFKRLDIAGNVNGSLDMAAGTFRAFDLTAADVAIDSHGGGIAVAGLNGRVDWRAGVSRPATSLGWSALGLYRIGFGPATLALEDRNGTLTLRQPVAASVLGGEFQLGRFAWQPDAGKSQRLSAAFAVTNVDVPALCKAFGWPAFGGKLGGAVPDLSYHGDDLVLGGGLSLNVFGGSVSVTNLSMRHPFGAMPELAADIDLQQLDLAQLTGVFDFGQITGRMDGGVHGLQLVGWKPVAFKADLTANGGGRISQHAIKSLTEVGGGGIAGGLQGMALRLFKTFGYARIGLSCTLANGVCSMGGISPDPDPDTGGYTIVEGSGLPRITVIGHQHAVDWATLMSRLKSATEGNGPVIN